MAGIFGGSIVMGVPPNGWFIMENPNIRWMRTELGVSL